MNGGWSGAIRRECSGSEARFELPARPLGWGRLLGVVLAGFGLAFLWGPARGILELAQKGSPQSGGDAESLLVLFQLVFVLPGILLVGLGLWVLFGRCRVEWKGGQLRATERLGPLGWTRRLPRRAVRRLIVGGATSRSPGGPAREWEQFSALTAEFEDGTKRLLVLGYPKSWLLELAQELSSYTGAATTAPVEVVEQKPVHPAERDVPEQPAGSRVQLEEHAGGIHLIVPPAGLLRGSMGLFIFALAWCVFMAVFTALAVIPEQGKRGVPAVFWIFIAVFWAIGVGLLLGALNMAKRSAVVVVEGDRLTVETRGVFRVRKRQWHRGELAAIRADASGIEVNDRPVIELQIHPRTGKKVGLLAGRNEEELRWMATRLRAALNLPAREQPD